MSSDAAMKNATGAPTRATILPTDPAERKKYPLASGLFDYFPDALAVVSNVSWRGNEQHNPGEPLHWNRGKSTDEADTMLRHFAQRGTLDTDGTPHTAKVVWRALAMLQKELEGESAVVDVPQYESDQIKQCRDRSNSGWTCTRTQGHTGRHVAFFHYGGEPVEDQYPGEGSWD